MFRPLRAQLVTLLLAAAAASLGGCAFPNDFDTRTTLEDAPEGDTSSQLDADIGAPDTTDTAEPEDLTDTGDTGDATDTSDTAGCPTGQTICGDVCVDLQQDAAHCGACDNACEDTLVCREGACCTECGDLCVDTTSADLHCGACDNACGENESCVDSACTCQFDVLTDPSHCGSCNQVCAEDAPVCSQGSCVELRNQIAVGTDHACMIDGGDLFCWGSNEFNQLGADAPDGLPVLVSRGGDAPWREVVAGHRFTCGLRADGAVYCWGENGELVLGQGNSSPVATGPALPVEFATGTPEVAFVHLTASTSPDARTVCGLTGEGEAYCWGDVGAQFNLVANGRATPLGVSDVLDLSIGDAHHCRVAAPGSLICSGGEADTWDLGGVVGVRTVFSGPGFACYTDQSTALRCVGANDRCELGRNDSCASAEPDVPAPVFTAMGGALVNVERVSLGGGRPSLTAAPQDGGAGCAVVADTSTVTRLLCWGDVVANAVGLPDATEPVDVATEVSGANSLELDHVIDVAVGRTNTCVMQESGVGANVRRTVACVGSNANGELGNGGRSVIRTPDLIHSVELLGNPVAIAATEESTCAVVDDGGPYELECWGGQPVLPAASPILPNAASHLLLDGAAASYCEAVAGDVLRCWGEGYSDLESPLTLAPEDAVLALAEGNLHSCALIENDSTAPARRRLECWGFAAAPPTELAPLQAEVQLPTTNSDVALYTDVAVSDALICLIKEEYDNQLLTTASLDCLDVLTNERFEVLNIGTASELDGADNRVCVAADAVNCVDTSHDPIEVFDSLTATVADLAVGTDHLCVAFATSSLQGNAVQVRCTGANDGGQLGGDPGIIESELELFDASVRDHEPRQLAVGRAHTCALVDIYTGMDAGRTVESSVVTCWGRNSDGQLGPQTASDSQTFVEVRGECLDEPLVCDVPCSGSGACDALVCRGPGVCAPVSCDDPACSDPTLSCDASTNLCQRPS